MFAVHDAKASYRVIIQRKTLTHTVKDPEAKDTAKLCSWNIYSVTFSHTSVKD